MSRPPTVKKTLSTLSVEETPNQENPNTEETVINNENK